MNISRPSDISEDDLVRVLEGLPKRYLTLFEAESIYDHVRHCRTMSAEQVELFLKKKAGMWELTVATFDKPFLFSNICGVLSYLGLDILDGQALTSTRGLVLDLFRFDDSHAALEESALTTLLRDVISGRADIRSLLQAKHTADDGRTPSRTLPVIAFDNEASYRYTVLEIVAEDAPGLLYRISRALSTFRCEIEMVVISTEQDKAVDVFHVRKDGTKLADSDELPLTEALEQALGSSPA